MTGIVKHRIIFFFLILSASPCFPQERMVSKYSVSFSGGLTIPLGDLRKGSIYRVFITNDFEDGYALSKIGMSFGGHFRYAFQKLPIEISFGFQANFFHNDTTITFGSIISNSSVIEKKEELKGRIFSFRSFVSYAIFVAGNKEFLVNIIPELNIIKGYSLYDGEKGNEIETTTRFGLGFGIIPRYRINKRFFVDIPISYHFANLLGKTYQEDGTDKIPLNDGSSKDDLVKSKSINYISILIQLGLNL